MLHVNSFKEDAENKNKCKSKSKATFLNLKLASKRQLSFSSNL